MRRQLIALGMLCGLLPGFVVHTHAAEAPAVSAASAVLMDAETGRVLYAHNEQEPRAIASTTKLMTALVAAEYLGGDLSETVEIKREWTGIEGTSLYLKPGETITLKTLLYGLLLHSGNDAANAVAVIVAGSIPNFVAMMNQRAQSLGMEGTHYANDAAVALAGICGGEVETFVGWMNQRAQDLGMTNTHFSDPNGLGDENHYASALDMAKLGVACLQNPTVAEILSTRTITLEGRQLTNHNKLLWQYEGCTGMKTGYTRQAGRTLVSSAERNGQTLVCVTLNDRDDWNDHKALLDYGFSAFPRQVLAEEGEELGRVPLQGSLLHMASVEARETVAYPLKQGEEVTMEVDLPDQAEAPVVQGEIAGSVRFLVGSRQVGQTYLVWSGSARRDVVKERPVDSPLDFLPQSTPPTYEEMLSLFSKAGTVSE